MTSPLGKVLLIVTPTYNDKELNDYFSYVNIFCEIEHNPFTGIEKSLKNHYDIIILEDYIYDTSGYIIAKEILNYKNTILFMLGKHMDQVSIIGAYRTGISAYIPNTISVIQLSVICESAIKRISSLISNSKQPQNHIISIGSITLNTQNGILYVDGYAKESLVKKETEILTLLLMHPDEYLSKKTIYEHVWQESYVEKENSVGNYISKIRHKLGDFERNEPRFIITKRNYGFKFKSKH